MSEFSNIKERLEKVEALVPHPAYADFIQSLRNDIRYLVDFVDHLQASHKEEIDRLTILDAQKPKTPQQIAFDVYQGSMELLMLLGLPHADEIDLELPGPIDLGEVSPTLLSNQLNPTEQA